MCCVLLCGGWPHRYLLSSTNLRVVVDPFCGRGSVLAVANDLGLHAIGVDWSPKRCRYAQQLVTSAADCEALSEDSMKRHRDDAGQKGGAQRRKAKNKKDEEGEEDEEEAEEVTVEIRTVDA
jgi:hypothetical protein